MSAHPLAVGRVVKKKVVAPCLLPWREQQAFFQRALLKLNLHCRAQGHGKVAKCTQAYTNKHAKRETHTHIHTHTHRTQTQTHARAHTHTHRGNLKKSNCQSLVELRLGQRTAEFYWQSSLLGAIPIQGSRVSLLELVVGCKPPQELWFTIAEGAARIEQKQSRRFNSW